MLLACVRVCRQRCSPRTASYRCECQLLAACGDAVALVPLSDMMETGPAYGDVCSTFIVPSLPTNCLMG